MKEEIMANNEKKPPLKSLCNRVCRGSIIEEREGCKLLRQNKCPYEFKPKMYWPPVAGLEGQSEFKVITDICFGLKF